MKRAILRTMLLAGLFALVATTCQGVGTQPTPTPTSGATATPTPTPDPFPEEDIVLINPFAGGNFESQSRVFAPIFQAKLPNNVRVIVENAAGGAGLIGYNRAIQAPADGYTLSIDDPIGNALRKIDQGGNAQFEPTAWAWLGGWFQAFAGLGVRANYEADTWEEFVASGRTGEIVFATPGQGTLNHGQQQILAKVFDLNFRYVHYQSTAEVRTALARGEVDAYIAPTSTIATWVDADELKWILILREGDDPQQPEVPTFDDIDATQEQKDTVLTVSGGTRGWMTNKNVPAGRVAILREAFWEAANDPEWIAALEQVGILADPIRGEELQEFAEAFWPTFPDEWAEATQE